MVVHYPPERLRRNSEQPTAIRDVLVPTTGPRSFRSVDIPLGMPTTQARSRRGLWALYPGRGDEVIVVHPRGAMAGPPAEVAAALGRLASGELERQIAGAFRAILDAGDGRPEGGAAVPARQAAAGTAPGGRPARRPAQPAGHDGQQPPAWPGGRPGERPPTAAPQPGHRPGRPNGLPDAPARPLQPGLRPAA
jgi:hypothetical protein